MKKFLTFLALACLMVTGAWAGNITTLDQVETDAKYTIQCPRGYLTVKTDLSKLEGNGVAGRTYNSEDACFQFQFVKDGDNYYLFNVGANSYSDAEGNMVANISSAAPILLRDQGNGTVQPYWDDTHNLNLGGQKQLAISDWKTADDGCRFTITKIELVNYTITVEGLSNGGGVSYKGNTYGNGQNLEILSSTVGEVSSIAVEGYVPVLTIKDTSIIVKYISTILPDFTGKAVVSIGDKTQNIQPNTWYVLTQVRNGETPAYDTGNGNQLKRANQTVEELIPLNTAVSSASQYLLRFINISGEAHIIQFATGQFWNVVNSSTTPGTYMVYATTRGGNIGGISMNVTNDLTSYGALIDNNGKNDKISTWGSGKITSGDNNVWYIYPVEIAEPVSTATVTYNYKFNGVIKHTTSSEQKVGNVVAAPAPVKIFTTLEYNTETVVENGGTTVDVTVKEATPFIAAESFDKIEHWYAMQIRENNWLYNTGTDAVTGTSTYEVSAKYAWGFVGNIYDGYVIYNKEAGNAVALDSNTPCTISADGISVIWNIPRVGTLGDASFGLQTSGQDPINWQNNTLKRWNGFDLGSSFRVEEVDMSLDGALKTAIAKDQAILTDAANLTALYSATDIATAKTAIEKLNYDAMSQSSIDEATATLNSIMETFYASANGKKFTYASWVNGGSEQAPRYLEAATAAGALTTSTAITYNNIFELENVGGANYKVKAVYQNAYLNSTNTAAEGSIYNLIYQGSENYVSLQFNGTTNAIHHQASGNKPVSWSTSSDASKWHVTAISDEEYNALLPQDVTYTVTSITGAEGKVIYNEHEYGVNDSFVAGNDLQSSNLSATPVEGYEYTITIDGSYNITLEYVSSSPIVARMADFVSAGTNNGATDITANYNVVEGGAVYSFEDNGYIGAISNPALAKLLNDGNKVITVAAWVYGNPTGGTFFGYGGQQNGVMLKDNSGSLQATWKGADDVQAQDGALADDQWNLVAYSFKSGVGCRYIISSGFYTRVNSAKMVTPPSVEQLFAVGSGNQEKARDCFNGILANLTIIKSDGQLNDSQVKEYIGAAPTAKETGLDITIGETGYATFYDEVARAIPEGVKAYYCNYNEGTGNLDTKDITVETDLTYIPAGVGVVLEGKAGTYTFNEVEASEDDWDFIEYIYYGEDGLTFSALGGTVEEITLAQAKEDYSADNIYVLSKVSDVIGFYKYEGETLGAHKAFYAPYDATEINGFALDFGGQTVGVSTVISATNLKAGFDIQGRRINKMQKGINILNGKKIIK